MTNPLLPISAAQRLARLLGMLGSDHDGEVVNAARLADRFVRELGLTWAQIILPPEMAAPEEEEEGWWQGLAEQIIDHHGYRLSNKEAAFLQQMTRWRGTPSPKQQKWIRDILARIKEAA